MIGYDRYRSVSTCICIVLYCSVVLALVLTFHDRDMIWHDIVVNHSCLFFSHTHTSCLSTSTVLFSLLKYLLSPLKNISTSSIDTSSILWYTHIHLHTAHFYSGWDPYSSDPFREHWIGGWWVMNHRVPCHVEIPTWDPDLENFDHRARMNFRWNVVPKKSPLRPGGKKPGVGHAKSVWFIRPPKWPSNKVVPRKAAGRGSVRYCTIPDPVDSSPGRVVDSWYWETNPSTARLKSCRVPIVFDNCMICIVVALDATVPRSYSHPRTQVGPFGALPPITGNSRSRRSWHTVWTISRPARWIQFGWTAIIYDLGSGDWHWSDRTTAGARNAGK